MNAPDIIANVARGSHREPAGQILGTERTGIAAALWTHRVDDVQEVGSQPDPSYHIICLPQSPYFAEMRLDGRSAFAKRVHQGNVCIVNAGLSANVIQKGRWCALQLYVPKRIIEDFVETEGLASQSQSVELIDPRCSSDALMKRIGLDVLSEMRDDAPLSRLRLDTLGQDLAIHLLRRHSNLAGSRSMARSPARGGLASWQVRLVGDAMVASMEHGEHEASLADLAQLVGLSANHFCRSFGSLDRTAASSLDDGAAHRAGEGTYGGSPHQPDRGGVGGRLRQSECVWEGVRSGRRDNPVGVAPGVAVVSATNMIGNVARGWNRDPSGQVFGANRAGVSAALWTHNADDVQELWAEPDIGCHIVTLTDTSIQYDMFIDGRMTFSRHGQSGHGQIVRAGERPRAIVSGPWRVLHMYLPSGVLGSVAALWGASAFELLDPACTHSAAIERVGREVIHEMRLGDPVSRLRVDILGQELAIQLLRNHSSLVGTRAVSRVQARGGLAPWQARLVCEAMVASMDGGEKEVGLADLALLVDLSANHFCRAFAQSTGRPPHRWMTERRIERAKAMMSDPRVGLTEVALAVGYANQSAFGRVFRRLVGTTPSEWRRDVRR